MMLLALLHSFRPLPFPKLIDVCLASSVKNLDFELLPGIYLPSSEVKLRISICTATNGGPGVASHLPSRAKPY